MRTGFMRLSSARYAMGADRVSLLQLPASMTATTRLNKGDGEIEIAKTASPGKLVNKNNNSVSASPSSSKTKEITNIDAKKDILAELGAKYGCDFGRDTIVGSIDDDSSPLGDPLHWFGALVSPNLRQAQQDFAAVLQLIVELANAKQRILDEISKFEQNQ